MDNQIQAVSENVTSALTLKYRGYVVNCEQIIDDPGMIEVAVFDVPSSEIKSIESYISKLENEICHSGKYCEPGSIFLIPMVRDIDTTKKYYSQHCKQSTIEMPEVAHFLASHLDDPFLLDDCVSHQDVFAEAA